MKAIIENRVMQPQGFNNVELTNEVNNEFVKIINLISLSKNSGALRTHFTGWKDYKAQTLKHFKIGFGGNHMWVHQIIDNVVCTDRIIFVEF